MPRIKLTDRYISNISSPKHQRLEVSDAICPGLHLRVTPKGVKTFSLVLRRGNVVRKTLGRYPHLTLGRARDEAMALLRDTTCQRAGDPAAQQAPCPTLAELVESYATLHLRPNLRSWKNVHSCLKQPAIAHLHAQRIDTIGKAQIVAACDALVAAGIPHAAVNLLKALRALFNWAISRGELSDNPCDRLRPAVRDGQRDRVLTDDEIRRVLRATPHMPAPFGDMVRLLLLTAARRSEVARMKWNELNGNVWTLPAERSKSGRVNVLPLPPAAIAILVNQPRGTRGDYVFSTSGGARPSSDFTKRKRLLDAASGTTDWCLHDLRRTCRSKLAELGVPREVARRILGHSVDQLDAIYDRHDYQVEKAAALSKLADHLAELHLTTNSAQFVARDTARSISQCEHAK